MYFEKPKVLLLGVVRLVCVEQRRLLLLSIYIMASNWQIIGSLSYTLGIERPRVRPLRPKHSFVDTWS